MALRELKPGESAEVHPSANEVLTWRTRPKPSFNLTLKTDPMFKMLQGLAHPADHREESADQHKPRLGRADRNWNRVKRSRKEQILRTGGPTQRDLGPCRKETHQGSAGPHDLR
jgi:hypothetical protein